jgi:hypothetical protein
MVVAFTVWRRVRSPRVTIPSVGAIVTFFEGIERRAAAERRSAAEVHVTGLTGLLLD